MESNKPDGNPSTEVITHPQGGGVVPTQSSILTVHDMQQEMPDLYNEENYARWPLDLASEYWGPKIEGESRRLLFSHMQTTLVPDKFNQSKGDELVPLETAIFFERKGENIKTVRQASKVLLTTLRSQNVGMGTLLEVVYLKRTQLGNGRMGDTWAVFPLKVLEKKPQAEQPASQTPTPPAADNPPA